MQPIDARLKNSSLRAQIINEIIFIVHLKYLESANGKIQERMNSWIWILLTIKKESSFENKIIKVTANIVSRETLCGSNK